MAHLVLSASITSKIPVDHSIFWAALGKNAVLGDSTENFPIVPPTSRRMIPLGTNVQVCAAMTQSVIFPVGTQLAVVRGLSMLEIQK